MASQSKESIKVELLERDWYAVLECNKDSTKKEIEKSARKLALQYHPDKTTDPKAPEKFLLIQKAKVGNYSCIFINISFHHLSCIVSMYISGYSSRR